MTFEEEHPNLKEKAHFVINFIPGKVPKETLKTRKGLITIKLAPEPNTFECKSVNFPGFSCRVYNEEDVDDEFRLYKQQMKKVFEDMKKLE